MPLKKEKLEQMIKKLLATTDPKDLTIKKVKRAIEEELGLETNDLDPQTDAVKEILLRLSDDQDSSEEDKTKEGEEKPPVVGKRKQLESPQKPSPSPPKSNKASKETKTTKETTATAKKAKVSTASSGDKPPVQENADGDSYWELHELKRVTIKPWKGQNHVDLRNFYKKDGDILPTPKGIMLTKDQWNTLKDSIEKIDELVGL